MVTGPQSLANDTETEAQSVQPHASARDRTRARLRRWVPRAARLRLRLIRRVARDQVRNIRFARRRAVVLGAFPFGYASYHRPFIDYKGGEDLARAKRTNQRVMSERVRGIAIRPGEVFSLWELAGRPDARSGYEAAAAVVNGRLIEEVGGSTCLLSTVIYNTALLGGLTIVERHPHVVDSYGESRYFELGRDASIEYGYKDLRFRNDFALPVVLMVEVDGNDGVRSELRLREPAPFSVSIEVSERQYETIADPVAGLVDAFSVRTLRRIRFANGEERLDDLGWSRYLVPGDWHQDD